MELDKFGRQLRLLILLTQNRRLTIEEIGEQLGMNRRSIYRYLDAMRAMGFIVKKEGTRYHIDHRSPFLRELVDGIQFSEDEAVVISQLLNAVYSNSPQVRALREKFAALYDTDVLERHGIDNTVAHNVSQLFRAIKEERVVLLRDYDSPSSGVVKNRIVEPYIFCSENSEVRCYELVTGENKTFKLSRCKSVELLDLLWSHKDKHKPYYTDLFHFSGEERYPVTLQLGHLSMNLLLEEYPDAERYLQPMTDGRYRLEVEVCSYKGIGRFVMGLIDDIQIKKSPDFVKYLKEKAALLTQKFGE